MKNSSANILNKVKEKVAIPFLNISSCSKQFLRIYKLGWIKEKIRYSSIKTSNTIFKKSDKNNDDSNKIQKTETFLKPKLSHFFFLDISQWKKKKNHFFQSNLNPKCFSATWKLDSKKHPFKKYRKQHIFSPAKQSRKVLENFKQSNNQSRTAALRLFAS